MGKITKLANIVAKAARVHKKAMIIDEILERKEGMPYNSKDFYDYVSYWAETDNDVGTGIARALDGGTEEDVKRELCKYIKEQGYNPAICDYINSVNWLGEGNDQNVIVGNAFPNEAKRIEDLLKQNNIEYKTSKKGKNIYFEIMFKGKDVWTVNDILNAVLEDRSKFHLVKRANINKKASDYKGKVAEMLNDINDPNPLIDYISESDAKKICEELDIPHEASWYKGDLRGYVEEIPDGMVDVLIEYISESDAESLWGMIANDMGIEAKKKSNLNKKAEEIEPGSIYEKAKAILPKEDIDHHETDLYLRVSPKSTELVNSMKYRNSGMITTFKDNIDGDMWYDLPFCYPYVDRREYENVPSKEEDEIILRQKKSSKRVKLTKKANYTLTDLVKEDIENIEMCLENIQTTYANALLTKLSMELQERLDNSIVESDLRDLFEVK